MTDHITVISEQIDGAALRRERLRNSRHLRCDGKADDAEINEALAGLNKKQYAIPASAWDRIFGGRP